MICKEIKLWKDRDYDGKDKNFVPVLDTYILQDRKRDDENPVPKKPAILICPGGGYFFTSHREAEVIAMQFTAKGYHAFVLYYDCAPNRHPQPLRDVTRAMCIIRDNANEWNVDSDEISVIGFSAGGHLAASLGVFWNNEELLDVPGMEKGKNKPNALILAYPVIVWGPFANVGSYENLLGDDIDKMADKLSLEKYVSKDTPPTFLWHTFEDDCVPVENSLMFAAELKKNDVPFEMHIFTKGGHGLSIVDKQVCNDKDCDPHAAHWVELCIEWLDMMFK